MPINLLVLMTALVLFGLNRRFERRFPTAPVSGRLAMLNRATAFAALLALAWFVFFVVSSFSDVSTAKAAEKAHVLEEGINVAMAVPAVIIILCVVVQVVVYVMWHRHVAGTAAAETLAPRVET